MVRSNGVCGVGVAYDAKISGIYLSRYFDSTRMAHAPALAIHTTPSSVVVGIRLIEGSVTDAQEAMSLSHNRNNVHIYSNSWGPSDGGYSVAGPGSLLSQAFMEGTQLVSDVLISSIEYESIGS